MASMSHTDEGTSSAAINFLNFLNSYLEHGNLTDWQSILSKSMNLKPETQKTTFKGASQLHNDCVSRFKMIRADNFDNIIVEILTINSISPKFDEFRLMLSGYFDVTIVTETKLDDSFPKAQFCIAGFSIPYRLDNRNGSGLMIYAGDDIPSKMFTKDNFPEDNKAAFIELNFRKCKWLLCATYRGTLPKS